MFPQILRSYTSAFWRMERADSNLRRLVHIWLFLWHVDSKTCTFFTWKSTFLRSLSVFQVTCNEKYLILFIAPFETGLHLACRFSSRADCWPRWLVREVELDPRADQGKQTASAWSHSRRRTVSALSVSILLQSLRSQEFICAMFPTKYRYM